MVRGQSKPSRKHPLLSRSEVDDIRVATPIDRVAEIVSARFAQNVRDAAPPVGLSYESWIWAGIALLVGVGVGVGFVMRRRRLPA